jgi:hypothetical protein
MLKLKSMFLLVVILLITSLACSVSGSIVPTPDANSINTSVAGTLIADSSQTSQSIFPVIDQASATAIVISEQFTVTPTLTLVPSLTFTPGVPQISVSVATNCRIGPGKAYDRVGALMVGEVAEVYGRDPTGAYWYIRNPDSGGDFCWLWGEYASLIGDMSALPIFTPPPSPTPTPSFEVDFDHMDACIGWWVDFKIKNTGTIAFKSISITLRDTTKENAVATMASDGFTNNDGCSSSSTKETLEPSNTRTVSSPSFTYDLTDHKMRATITVCTGLAQGGTCISQVINFKP